MNDPHTDTPTTPLPPENLRASASAIISGTPEYIFDYISRLENNRHWNWSITSTTPLTPGPVRKGSIFSQSSAAEPDEPQILEVITVDAPRLLAVEARGSRMTVTYRYHLHMAEGVGTDLKVEATVLPHHPVGLPDLFMARLRSSLDANLHNLRTVITSRDGAPP